jgi:hypothetical protein
MNTHRSRRLRSSRAAGAGDYAFECLSRLARILVLCGHSPRDLPRYMREVCRPLGEPSRRWDPERLNFLADLPHVIALWYSDPGYLAAGGRPAALAADGRGATLRSLIERVLPSEDPETVARTLLDMKAIRRQGSRYLPTGRNIAFRQDSARLHSLSVLMRILRTIERNIAGPKAAAILERNAIHPRFPVAALPGFHRRLKTRAADFLWDTDGDMRRRARRVRRGPMTRVGVEIFAFEEPLWRRRTGKPSRGKIARKKVPPRSTARRRNE